MAIHWFLIVAFIIIVIQAALFRYFGQRGLSYKRYFSKTACYQGEEVELVERIANRNFIPVPWLRLESLIHASLKFQSQTGLDINDGAMFQNHKSLFSLMPFTQITRKHRIACTRRGCYRLNTAALTFGDLLGLYRNTLRLTLDVELLVYPKIAELNQISIPSHSWQGDMTVRRWIVEDPFMISGVREYRYGDPLNGINWKATARSGRLQVHQHDYTADHRLMILLNVEDHEKMWNQVNDEALFEQGVSYAAAFAQYAIGQGMEAGFGSNAYLIDMPKQTVHIEPRSGPEQMTFILETMARLVVARSIPFDDLLEQFAAHNRGASRMDLVIISAYVSAKMQTAIEQLEYNGNGIQVVLLQKEENHSASVEQAGAGA
ncbi:DUF58 domain-containing protein [Paenibacillus radicis (ex Xue et al. 2023)]|uniref:DUF58 domain-containing protein n=1 Tax=Paenibacillus radicis (ex Xue et al. 2023) TaxID=2972489 RepID=A0ABT1YG70_9BACL|nr:DUF58 domain-containing protein [Paenibacillus radicis (ex Xue et al. 2023)]MCR8631715.1 DUF58 domain-containing protein [Paenibacillus radicis (ex Xue et al. 2023)]